MNTYIHKSGFETLKPNKQFLRAETVSLIPQSNSSLSPSKIIILNSKPSSFNQKHPLSKTKSNSNFEPFITYSQPNPKSEDTRQLLITLQFNKEQIKDSFLFQFKKTSLVSQLIQTLHKKVSKLWGLQITKNLIYYKTGNIHLDYFLTIPFLFLKEIPIDIIRIKAFRIGQQILVNVKGMKPFEIIKCIGSGGFSRVYLIRAYGILMGLKVIEKQIAVRSGKQCIISSEKQILQICQNHPFVTKLYMTLETDKYVIFGMEFCNGGQLFHLLKKVKRMKQIDAQFYFLEALCAIGYLHSKNIIYRDLKPQNILIDASGHIRLADYGLSKIMSDQRTYSFCGSAEYMAPQMLLKKGHGYQIDYYCMGALLYELVTGLPPYYSQNQEQLFENILNKKLVFPESQSYPLSNEIKVFLTKLLSKDVNERFHTIEEMFSYDWLKDVSIKDVMEMKLKPPFKTHMFNYNFDDEDFGYDQKIEITKLQMEMEKGQCKNPALVNFNYQNNQIKSIINQIQTEKKLKNSKQTNPQQKEIQNKPFFQLVVNKNNPLKQGEKSQQKNSFKCHKPSWSISNQVRYFNSPKNCMISKNKNNIVQQVPCPKVEKINENQVRPKNQIKETKNIKQLKETLQDYQHVGQRINNILGSNRQSPLKCHKSPQPIQFFTSFDNFNPQRRQMYHAKSQNNLHHIIPFIKTQAQLIRPEQKQKSVNCQQNIKHPKKYVKEHHKQASEFKNIPYLMSSYLVKDKPTSYQSNILSSNRLFQHYRSSEKGIKRNPYFS